MVGNAIHVRLTKPIGNQLAVDEVSIDTAAGEMVALPKPTGAGKTTTLRSFNGVATPDAGETYVLGYSFTKEPLEIERRIGVVTEERSLDDRLTVKEDILFFAEFHSMPSAFVNQRIGLTLHHTGLCMRSKCRARGPGRRAVGSRPRSRHEALRKAGLIDARHRLGASCVRQGTQSLSEHQNNHH